MEIPFTMHSCRGWGKTSDRLVKHQFQEGIAACHCFSIIPYVFWSNTCRKENSLIF